MRLYRKGCGLIVETPAKLNLFFEVLQKRSDGYHEVETLMCPIDLYDTLYVEEDPDGPIQLSVVVAGVSRPGRPWLAEIPTGPENLVVRALEALRQQAGVSAGIRVQLVKRIPTAAGLGGGSSDAAAALVAGNAIWDAKLSHEELARLAAALGSDVPFFLAGGAAICRGRGERIESISTPGNLNFVVVRPPEGLSTAAVYRACRPVDRSSDPSDRPRSVGPLLGALRSGDLRGVGALLCNRLEPAAEGLSPWIGRLRQEMDRMEVPGQIMSGSGSSYFGLCRHARHAQMVRERLQARSLGCVFAVRSCR